MQTLCNPKLVVNRWCCDGHGFTINSTRLAIIISEGEIWHDFNINLYAIIGVVCGNKRRNTYLAVAAVVTTIIEVAHQVGGRSENVNHQVKVERNERLNELRIR